MTFQLLEPLPSGLPIATDDGGSEPWVFLVGTDGTIAARWDNVLDEAELVALLEAVPRTP